ncbi:MULTISPECIES: PhzF family phenazine biosynthesis protein [Clostridium]|nr:MULTISPECIES: PhzF family phenazine biosynthesis protein [Clostridium]MDU0321556.1 PhzF family phenazine biosynthesis protein [Clostridium butyricum]MDU4587262.1 PhzF family phenazine biosynthesis protein [Clostridium sp.]MDU5104504.1 PhzF family phenazine biosynthesis protein [Clostridium butyricum]OFS23348.1 phenazine biosynthesis protein [Clostridium sp. HMSC19A10]QUF84890.1 PhzF family phenazine biosynthesis protein [Clostridium butyricum]
MKMYIVDAFAEKVFQGNSAAVCITDSWMNEDKMQAIAAENNLSETAFIVKEGEVYHIRWFTPLYEIDLCGHATLASAFIIDNYIAPNKEIINFTSQSGDLQVKCRDGLYTLNFPSRPPQKIEKLKEVEEVLGIEIKELFTSRDLMAVVENENIIKNLTPNFDKMKDLSIGDGIIVTAEGSDCDFVSRCFYPKCGVNEDPVTGSAHCNLIPYWSERLGKTKMNAKQISERGGILYCKDCDDRVEITGKAVIYAISEIFI